MTQDERPAFDALLTRVCGVLSRPVPDDLTCEFAFAVIAEAIPDVSIGELVQAAKRHLAGCRYYPTPSHLIELVNDQRDRNLREQRETQMLALPVPPPPEPEPTREESLAAFRRVKQQFAERGVVLGNVGKPMRDGTQREPWVDPRSEEEKARSMRETAELVRIELENMSSRKHD